MSLAPSTYAVAQVLQLDEQSRSSAWSNKTKIYAYIAQRIQIRKGEQNI